MKVLTNFDRVVTEVLAEKVKAKLSFKVGWRRLLSVYFALEDLLLTSLLPPQGHLDTYRFCDDVWTFLIKDVNFKLDNGTTIHADKVKIVSCNSKRPGEV